MDSFMEPMTAFLFVFIVLIVVIGVVGYAVSQRDLERHRAEMAAWAAAHGLHYLAESDQLAQMFSGEPFTGGSGGHAIDILSGPTPGGHQFWSYIYQYTVSNGKTSQTVKSWVVLVQMHRILPWLNVTFDSFGAKLAQVFGDEDIEVESDDFNKTYCVHSGSPQFAFAVLNPPVIDWLLGPGQAIVPFRFVGQDMIWWCDGDPVYQRLGWQVRAMEALIEHIPSFVWDDYGRSAHGTPGPNR